MLHFTKYAIEKFEVLRRHGIVIKRSHIEYIIAAPLRVNQWSHQPLVLSDGELDLERDLRVCYIRDSGVAIVLTFYPIKKPKKSPAKKKKQ